MLKPLLFRSSSWSGVFGSIALALVAGFLFVTHSPISFGLFIPAAVFGFVQRQRLRNAQTMLIASDRETHFTHTTAPSKESSRKAAVIVPSPHHPDWDMADSVFHDLEGCQWIADSQALTQQEAMTGGSYFFERSFQLPEDATVVSAELLMLVDNWCSPTVNGTELVRRGGKVVMHTWDITSRVQGGDNLVIFEVVNNPGVAYLSDDDRWPEWNPYGFKYLIRVHFR